MALAPRRLEFLLPGTGQAGKSRHLMGFPMGLKGVRYFWACVRQKVPGSHKDTL